MNLDKSLSGTMVSRYYPHKTFIDSLYVAYNTLYEQLQINIKEIQDKLMYSTCPQHHTEKIYEIILLGRASPYTAGVNSLKASNSYICQDSIIFNYKIDKKIVSADGLTITNGVLYSDKPLGYSIWATNVKFTHDYVYDSIGCIFGYKNMNLVLPLLYIIRFGFIKEYVEEFLREFFNDPILEIKDSKECNYYTYENIVYTHIYKSYLLVWGEGIWGQGVWGEEVYTHDSYLDCPKITYIVESDYVSTKGLEHLTRCVPIWLNFCIFTKKTTSENYKLETDSATFYHSFRAIDYYNKVKDGAVTFYKWGEEIWDEVKEWGDDVYHPYIRIIKNETY